MLLAVDAIAYSSPQREDHHRLGYVTCRQEAGRIELDYYGRYYGGLDTMHLSSALENYCEISPADIEVREIELVAKSRFGLGYAYVEAGEYKTHSARVGGSPLDFDGPYGYDRVFFEVPPHDPLGPLNLVLRGEMRVGMVVFHLNQ
jgi:hypothetical protein